MFCVKPFSTLLGHGVPPRAFLDGQWRSARAAACASPPPPPPSPSCPACAVPDRNGSGRRCSVSPTRRPGTTPYARFPVRPGLSDTPVGAHCRWTTGPVPPARSTPFHGTAPTPADTPPAWPRSARPRPAHSGTGPRTRTTRRCFPTPCGIPLPAVRSLHPATGCAAG